MPFPPAALICAAVATVAASGVAAQERVPARYATEPLACAAFQETVRTTVRGDTPGASVRNAAGRDGRLLLAARDSAGLMLLEAWYDSLAVWRDTDAGREVPDAEGVLGGRYRGVLGADGRYRSLRTPFVPAELADVAELASVLDDFLPRLPPVALAVGAQWSDSGVTIRRIADHRAGGEARHRYTWTVNRREGDRYPTADSLEVTVDQAIREEGTLLWSPRFGPLTWTRTIAIAARIPATGGVKRAVRSTIEQRIDVVRLFDPVPRCR